MKRVLVAVGLALLAHGLLLAMASGWLRKRPVDVGEPETVTLTLAYYRPQKEQTGEKGPGPPKKGSKQRPAFKQKPKKKALNKPPAMKMPRRAEKKATPPKVMTDREGVSGEKAEAEQKEAETKDASSLPDTGLSKGGAEETAFPAAPRIALKGPARTPLRQAIPIYKENPSPPYPRMARRRGYEGITILEVLVNREGKVDDVRLSSSSGHPVLDRAAKSSVKKWVFIPAVRGNKKVEMWVKIPIRFQLR